MSESAMSRITCTVRTALETSGLGRTKLYELMDSGRLESIKIGKRRLIKIESLEKLLDDDARE
jgi:excisionase family DNA binding protein